LKKQSGRKRGTFRKPKAETRDHRITEDNWEALLDQHGQARRRAAADESAELPRAALAAPDLENADYAGAGIVISVSSGRCKVFLDGQELDVLVPGGIAVRQKSSLAVGDRVRVEQDSDVWKLTTVLPRRTVLARPDPLHAHMQRLIAANIDVVIHVVSLRAPVLRPRLIDRYLIAIQRGGASPVICVNKVDLLDDRTRAEELARLTVYGSLEVPVVVCSTRTGEGLDQLRQLVTGKTSALVGHSGVGKSSILNGLDAHLQLATNTMHKRGTGRHTTTASTLYDFGDQTYLIDTPGIREFGLWDLDRERLRDYFPEFAEPSELCRFTDCTHVHEPNCEVKEQVAAGTLNEGRYETYARLFGDLSESDS
jgi:ribosome biogenesis GTPase